MDLPFCFELTSFHVLGLHSSDGQWCGKIYRSRIFQNVGLLNLWGTETDWTLLDAFNRTAQFGPKLSINVPTINLALGGTTLYAVVKQHAQLQTVNMKIHLIARIIQHYYAKTSYEGNPISNALTRSTNAVNLHPQCKATLLMGS